MERRGGPRLIGAARVAVVSVLEEFSEALAVYQRGLRSLRSEPDGRTKYSDVKNTEDIFRKTNEDVIFEKYRLESKALEDAVRESIVSLEREGSFGGLINDIVKEKAARAEEEEIFAKLREMEEQLARTRQDVAAERRRREEEMKHLKAELLRLRNEKEKLRVKSREELPYVRNWLKSQHEQEALGAEKLLDWLDGDLVDSQHREAAERRTSESIRTYLRRTTETLTSDARVWMNRRHTETKSYNKEIQHLQREIEEKQRLLEELRKEYTEKQEFIDGYLAEKEARRKKLEHEDYVRRRAIRIQAWWRGVMVRRKLGPYRPEDKKRKRPTKSKK